MEFIHEPVMLRECLDALCIRPDGIYVDGTMGGAGHSSEIAKVLGPAGKLIGIDQDEDAIKAAGGRLREYGDRVIIVCLVSHIGYIEKLFRPSVRFNILR